MSSPSRTGRFLNLSFTQDTQHLIHALPPHATQQRPFCSSMQTAMEFTQRGLAKALWSSRPPLREYTAPSRFLFSANPHTRRGLLSAPPHHRRSSSLCPTARDQTPQVSTSPQSNAANMGIHQARPLAALSSSPSRKQMGFSTQQWCRAVQTGHFSHRRRRISQAISSPSRRQ